MFIILNDRFSASRDSHGWTLTETMHKVRIKDKAPADGQKGWKKGDTYRTTNQTFHGSLQQVCRAAIDKSAITEDTETIGQAIEVIVLTSAEIVKAISAAGIE